MSVTGRTLVIDVATDDLTWNERIRLPQTLDVEATTANYANGRLTVVVPSAPEAQPRKVEITVGAPAVAELDSAGRSVRRDQRHQRHRVTELARQLAGHREEIPFGKNDQRLRPVQPLPPHRRPPRGGRRPRTG